MRETLDKIKFQYNEILYTIELWWMNVSYKAKNTALYVCLFAWALTCGIIFIDTREAETSEINKYISIPVDVPKSTMNRAYELEEMGRKSEAFNSLATLRNNFSDAYSKDELESLERKLTSLAADAKKADIAELYLTKDLIDIQPIYKFSGVVVQVDEDPMYGVTFMVSVDGEIKQEQLEVTGLKEVTEGSSVEFVGVPTFDGVASPMKVQAFVLPAKEE